MASKSDSVPAKVKVSGTTQEGEKVVLNEVVVQTQASNGLAIAGFILALLSLFFFWIPVIDLILWLIGLILSAVGMTKKPNGFAIAGLVISAVKLIQVVSGFLLLFGFFAAFS